MGQNWSDIFMLNHWRELFNHEEKDQKDVDLAIIASGSKWRQTQNSPTLMFKGQTFAGLARSLLPTALLRFARQAGAGELLGKEITNLQGQLFLAKISYRENILMPDIALF